MTTRAEGVGGNTSDTRLKNYQINTRWVGEGLEGGSDDWVARVDPHTAVVARWNSAKFKPHE